MRVLGIDPGSLNTGYGVIESDGNTFHVISYGCISSKSKDDFTKRYRNIYSELTKVIHKTHPEVISLENVIYCNNTKIAIKLGEARGVAILAAANTGIPVSEYSPKKIKQAVTGNGNASKVQVQEMIKRLLCFNKLPQLDTADALAAAICHINNNRLLTINHRI